MQRAEEAKSSAEENGGRVGRWTKKGEERWVQDEPFTCCSTVIGRIQDHLKIEKSESA